MARRRPDRAEDAAQGARDPGTDREADASDDSPAGGAPTPEETASGTSTGAGSPSARRERRGGLAAETYAAVERLTAEEGLSRSEAFARLGTESDRRPATVAAAYYRAARQRGQGRAARAPGVAQRRQPRAAAGRSRAGDAERLLQTATAALAELSELVRRQSEELLRLRADEERYSEIRALIEGTRPGRRGRPRS
jgi:hypothetical protein